MILETFYIKYILEVVRLILQAIKIRIDVMLYFYGYLNIDLILKRRH